ncbi:MAG: hypothetical protein ABI600_02690 [Luteolibacter sp.]
MKISKTRQGFLFAAIAGACLFPFISTAANIIVGTGSDTSYLVLQSTNLGVRTYEIHYTFNPGGSQDGYSLLSQVLTSDPTLAIHAINYGSVQVPSYYIDSISLNGTPETGVATSPYVPYWVHWVSGGFGYQNPDFSFNVGAAPVGSWTLSFGVSAHIIQPGSWDALFYSDGTSAPSVVPIPEPSSGVLAILGSVVIFKRRRIS